MHELLIFKDDKLRQRALTHRSYVNENPECIGHNERLEFLGDAILTYISGDYLYQQYPEMSEGEMTRQRSALVDKKQLARFAVEIELESKIKVGEGMVSSSSYQNERLLSSTFEAIVGAYYLDNNRDVKILRPLVEKLFNSVPKAVFVERSSKDPKNQLQEYVQADSAEALLEYVTERIGGTDHEPEFVSRVYIDGVLYGEGKGCSKKAAEREAARDALARLKKRGLC